MFIYLNKLRFNCFLKIEYKQSKKIVFWYEGTKGDKYGSYFVAEKIPYFLSSPSNYDESFIEWIIVSKKAGQAIQYTMLSFACRSCTGALIVRYYACTNTLTPTTNLHTKISWKQLRSIWEFF